MSYVSDCKDFIVYELERYEDGDVTIVGNELVSLLTERILANGSETFDAQDAEELINSWGDELSDVENYLTNVTRSNTDKNIDPEKFHVEALSAGVSRIVPNLPFVRENWYNEIDLTSGVVGALISDVDRVDAVRF